MTELMTGQLNPEGKARRAPSRFVPEFVLWLWGGLLHPWLLAAIGGGAVFLLLCALFIRQLPGQIRQDPTAATRWLLGASTEYGWPGNLLRGLGLFDVLHSPLLQIVVALLGLILFVRLGNELAVIWQLRQVQARFSTAVGTAAGLPLPLPALQPIYRRRQALPQPPHDLFSKLYTELQRNYTTVTSKEETLETAATAAPQAPIAESQQVDNVTLTMAVIAPSAAPDQELRLLALRHVRWTLVRPLFLAGLLLALAAVWFSMTAGWSVSLAAVAPGEMYHDVAHNLTVTYNSTEDAGSTAPITVQIQQMSRQLAVGDSTLLGMGQVRVKSRKGPPGLLISSLDGKTVLARRPDQPPVAASIGLIFPSMGSEESVVVNQQVGLRIVRMSALPNGGSPLNGEANDADQFIVEFYAGNSPEPAQRALIMQSKSEVIKIEAAKLALRFTPLPSTNIEVRYQPGNWLLLPALLLTLCGAAGFVRRPAFLLAQLAPWPTNRTVLILQAHNANDLTAIHSWLGEDATVIG